MIHLTAKLVPSTLFWHNAPLDSVHRLLEKADRLREAGDLREAERHAEDARKSSQQARAHIEHAAALVCLSDIYRDMGKLGPALRCGREAYDILRQQPGLPQRHNEAVAAYNMGLIHHLLGNHVDALNWYQTARRMFELAREYWAARGNVTRVRTCTHLERWIRNLSNCLTRTVEHSGFHSTLIIPARLMGGGNDLFSVAELKISGYFLGQHIVIGNRAFQVHTLTGEEVAIRRGEEYRVFEVPESACPPIEAEKGDYVLVQRAQREDPTMRYCVVEGASWLDFGRFQRDATGTVSFESLLTGRIIGGLGDGDFSIYHPIALLKPTG